jgi:hypothetical protein
MAGGAEGSRTPDLLIANETLYQLSYDPSRSSKNPLKKNRRAQLEMNCELAIAFSPDSFPQCPTRLPRRQKQKLFSAA